MHPQHVLSPENVRARRSNRDFDICVEDRERLVAAKVLELEEHVREAVEEGLDELVHHFVVLVPVDSAVLEAEVALRLKEFFVGILCSIQFE